MMVVVASMRVQVAEDYKPHSPELYNALAYEIQTRLPAGQRLAHITDVHPEGGWAVPNMSGMRQYDVGFDVETITDEPDESQ
jgi:hypothetical protein